MQSVHATESRDPSSGSAPARRSIWKKCGLLVASTLACLVIGEIASRVYFSRHVDYHIEMSRYAALLKEASPDPRIGHVHRRNRSARLMGVDVQINSDGFRDRDYPSKRPGVHRIVILGDSLTLGWGVEREETFEHLLEERMNRARPVEIVNFGTGNYNTVQEVALFRARGDGFEPDQVCLFYFINDAEPLRPPSSWGWLAHSRFLTLGWSRMRTWVSPAARTSWREYYATLYRPEAEGWRSAQAALLELREICRNDGIALQVILLPELHQLTNYPFRAQHAAVTSFLGEHGMDFLDATPGLDPAIPAEEYWVARDDAHPNARAHRVIADFIFPFVSGALDR